MRSLVAASIALPLSACAFLSPPKPPPETYDISAPRNFDSLRGVTRAQLLVKEPTALKAIDSEQILLKPSPSVIAYLSGAQWSDRVPKMVQAKLTQAFENTERARAVAKPGDGLVIDYQLVMDLRRFQIEAVNGGDRAVVELTVKLLNDRNGRVLRTRIFEATAATRGSDNDDYVAALDAAFDKVTREIIEWVLRRV